MSDTERGVEAIAHEFNRIFRDEQWFIVRDDIDDPNVLRHQAAHFLAIAAVQALGLTTEQGLVGGIRKGQSRLVGPWRKEEA